jgi:MGT family glycosyltransferase
VHREALGDKLPANARVYALDDSYRPPKLGEQARGLESVRLFFEDYLLPLTQHSLAPLEEAVRDFAPQAMAVDHQMLGGALVARKFGLPWVSLVSTTASIVKLAPVLDDWVAEQYLAVQQNYLSPSQIVERPDFSPHAVIVFSIEALLGAAHDRVAAPYAFVGPASGGGRRDVEFPWDWLRDDGRAILVTLGTVSRDRDHRFFEVMMEAVAQMPKVQAVMVAPPVLAETAPENVLVRDYVPQLALLDRVRGVVCHAGHNTVCEALLRGLPLAVAPIRDDQPVIARQVIDAGAGLFVRHGKVTPATARATIERLLDDAELAANARRLGQELRAAPGVAGAADILVRLSQQAAPCT